MLRCGLGRLLGCCLVGILFEIGRRELELFFGLTRSTTISNEEAEGAYSGFV
jgi:hypothetical protein